ATQFDIYLQSNFNPEMRDITLFFTPDVITLGTVNFRGQQLYYDEQAADFVPFPTATAQSYIPAALKDKTNGDLFKTYGLAIGGIVAPSDATTNPPRIHGILGKASSYPPVLYLWT